MSSSRPLTITLIEASPPEEAIIDLANGCQAKDRASLLCAMPLINGEFVLRESHIGIM